MKPVSPHDALDELIAAALHGELTPEERTQFESRLQNEPAARAAYQESQLMHDLLEKTHQTAQPDPAFEQRMVSGVRRKIHDKESHHETAWESVLVLWRTVRGLFRPRHVWQYGATCGVVLLAVLSFIISTGNQVKGTFTTITSQLAYASSSGMPSGHVGNSYVNNTKRLPRANTYSGPTGISGSGGTWKMGNADIPVSGPTDEISSTTPSATMSMPAPVVVNSSSVAQVAHNQAKAWDKEWSKDALQDGQATATPESPATTVPDVGRKLIRNAELELEVKNFQTTMDQIAALTRDAGGYVDTSSSERGGNGKLQGTVVVKVLPQNLDAFLLKLRDLGELKNQSLSTEDVTKEYFDTQARLENSRRMEEQLQELLKRDNGKVSDLLQVERELGRVRGQIEQMQGQLKLYDFQVQYATVTMRVIEKDLNQAAAYLLKEQDNFSLFAADVEGTFQQARHTAEDFKAQILTANLNHNSGTDVSADLEVMVPPEQIESFLAQVRTLGRVDNFTRQTQRVAKDGGDSDQPADQALTEKDKVQVHLTIRSDDESPRQQTDLSVLASNVDDKAQQIKKDAATAGVDIRTSSFERDPDGTETAQMTFRLPMSKYSGFVQDLQKLGKTESLTVHRDDRPDQTRSDDSAPVEISLRMHNQGDIVADNNGLWATLRRTFGNGVSALLGSVSTICVVVAFLAPWVFMIVLLAWVGRRIYIWRKK